jgi:hypothetical protein
MSPPTVLCMGINRGMLTFEEFLIEQNLNDDDARSILGLPVGYSPNDLKAAYYKAAKRFHPDSATGNPEVMKQVNAAYLRLKDSKPQSPVTPSTAKAQATASQNDPDASWKADRERRRAELLVKQQKKR